MWSASGAWSASLAAGGFVVLHAAQRRICLWRALPPPLQIYVRQLEAGAALLCNRASAARTFLTSSISIVGGAPLPERDVPAAVALRSAPPVRLSSPPAPPQRRGRRAITLALPTSGMQIMILSVLLHSLVSKTI